MNKVYKLMWSSFHGAWMVCSELGKRTKSSGIKTILVTAGVGISAGTFAVECTKGSQGEYNISTNGTSCTISSTVQLEFGDKAIRYPAGVWLQAGLPQVVRIVNMDIDSVDIQAIYSQTGDKQVYFANSAATEGVGIEVSGSTATTRTVMTVKGDTTVIMDATGAKQWPSKTDPQPSTTEAAVNFTGIAVDTGAEINLNNVNVSVTPKYTAFSAAYAYGLLAGSYLNIREDTAFTGRESIINIAGNLNIDMKLSDDTTGYKANKLLSGIRAIQGANEEGTTAFQGSTGVVIVNGDLDLNITGANVEGIYASGSDSRVELNGENNKIKIESTNSASGAIKLGKNRNAGSGSGKITVRGNLEIDNHNTSTSSAAIQLLNKNSVFDAQYNTNSLKVTTTGDVFSIGGSDWGTESEGELTKVLLSNANLTTTTLNKDVFKISSGQKAVLIDINGDETNITAAANGYILNSAGTTNSPSTTTMDFSDGYMKGLVKKSTNDTVNLNLDNARWQLEKSNQVNTALFSQLNLTNASEILAYNSVTEPSQFILSGQVNSKDSTLNLSNGILGDTLTINGDYAGDNGIVVLDTELGDDQSNTDKLVISGAATGSTQLKVNNVGGTGDQTVKGIHVIQTGSSASENTFYLAGNYISVGAYDYSLHLKKAEVIDELSTNPLDNWYLESKLAGNKPDPEPKPPVYTPDVGSYLAVETMGNTLFTSRLEDREGASRFQNLEQDNGNVWIRAYGGHHKFKSMGDQLKTKGNSFVTQIGTGLVSLGEEDQYNLGVMGGYAHYRGDTSSKLTSRESKATIDGYSLGLYGTWYAYPVEKRGAYIDTWVLWNSFKNKVESADRQQYKYDSSGVTASIEVGGEYLLNKNGDQDWWLQPQSQLIYQGIHADSFQDAQGTTIDRGSDNLQARLGFKTYLEIPTEAGSFEHYRPYLALNYIHNTNSYSVMINQVQYENEGMQNLGEFKLGIEGYISRNSQVWMNASYVAGSHSNQTYQGNLGWKYNF